jgi:hypothetical protein
MGRGRDYHTHLVIIPINEVKRCQKTKKKLGGESQRVRDHYEDQDVGGWIKLRWIF